MKKLLVITALLFSTQTFAGALIEPYLGYYSGSSEIKNTTGTKSKDTGMGYGARLGMTFPLIFIAADYSLANLDSKPDNGGAKSKVDSSMLGLDVGVDSPLGLRAWVGYSFSSKFKYKPTTGSDVEYKGKGYKVGLGYKFPLLPLSINLEYLMNTYDKGPSGSLTNKLESKGFFISVSAPLML